MDTDVLICGAGAAGLTLAIDLARRGVSFLLIDQAAAPFAGSRGKGIQPRTLEIFEALDVADRMIAAGGRYPSQRHYAADGSHHDEPTVAASAATPAEPYGEPLMLPQHLTDGMLRARLAELGHAPRYAHALVGFTQDDSGVTAHVHSPVGEHDIRARYLVGADGGRSFVRKTLDIGFPGESLNARAVVADLSLSGLTREVWHRWGKGGQQISLCPLQGTTLFQLQMPIPLDGEFDLSDAGIAAAITARTGRADIQVHAVHWRSDYAMSARLADRYRVGRVFIAGDAAHVHPPTGGQGLNTSVQDAWNLGWKLAAVLRGADEALLDTYEEERREVAADMLGMSTRLLDAARERGDLRRGREQQQLDLGYPASSLSLDERGDDAVVRAGYRAPDAPCIGAGGQPLRLFSLLKSADWILLRYEPAGAAAIAPRRGLRIITVGQHAELRDHAGHLRAAYGFTAGDIALIRPDGYLAALTHDEYSPALAKYIDRLLA
ncbi:MULTISPECIES: FAD-dependent oxidoreductase [unclassified Duganella]|uniref:FAD-dependent oxidoreductase n=1 Tax=unclassified Duganella TaxID=2636909 RepID=UPI00087FA80F|nr:MULTISPECIES: FAD-dependent oxidoreductase [unclassified Duganella]SDG26860.1 2-polyprenyl-6-methoxyphenol hydroxylase [Duganella sp. OV458]SDJ21033.1 2-polyprenyl-6-methoxyphenol hydroxylase [Duganella sp. OV510]